MSSQKYLKSDPIYCTKCHKTMRRGEFYTSNNLEKYPNGGTVDICKKCMTMHVDNWDPKTYLWILQELDVPYVPQEWNAVLAKYGKDPDKITGMTILGRYLSKMKLKQYVNYRWKDSEFIQELKAKKAKDAMEQAGKTDEEIQRALDEARIEAPEIPMVVEKPEEAVSVAPVGQVVSLEEDTETAESLGLTPDDVQRMTIRWGKAYKPSEWIQLERYYEDFCNSYDIQTAGHKDTLKKLSKVSLKLDQLIDIGDVDGAQKMQKMYDSLMKAGKFDKMDYEKLYQFATGV